MKERVSFLEMGEKSLEAKVLYLSENARVVEMEWNKIQDELTRSQSIYSTLINKLQMKNQEYQSQLALVKQNLQQKDEELAFQHARHEKKIE